MLKHLPISNLHICSFIFMQTTPRETLFSHVIDQFCVTLENVQICLWERYIPTLNSV